MIPPPSPPHTHFYRPLFVHQKAHQSLQFGGYKLNLQNQRSKYVLIYQLHLGEEIVLLQRWAFSALDLFLFLTADYKWSSSPVDAPSARALAMWPTFWMPPSAMTGTPKRLAYSDTLYTAVACGLPHASTDRGKINKSTIIQNKIHSHNYTTSDLHAQRKNVSRWPLSQHALCL